MIKRRIQAPQSSVKGVVVAALCFALSCGSVAAGGLVGVRAARVASPGPQASSAEVTAVAIENRSGSAQLAFDISRSVQPTSFVLSNPDRAIIDLPQVDFAIGPEVGDLGAEHGRHLRHSLLASFRFGLLSPGRSRIVIDLAQPARIVRTAVQVVDGRAKLIVSFAKTDRSTFDAAARDEGVAAVARVEPPVLVPTPGAVTIVIDAGHGGPDTGAIVNGVVEKDVTLAFAKMLASKLDGRGKFAVVMTRGSDVFIPLSERVRIARSAGAALMISVHADTLPETADVSGATVYTVSDKASDAYAAKVAAKENDADATVGVTRQTDTADVNDILFDLTRQETRAYSHVFARTLVNYWKVAGRLNKNPHRAAGFVVLKAPDVPSVLLELGYLSNPADSAALTSDEWRQKATGRMAEAILAYFADQHGPAKAAAGVRLPDFQASANLSASK